jgi:hypothetical protein
VDPLDWKRPGASVITQRILSQVRPGAIILSHDIHKQTIDAMPATLDGLISKGYKFVTVTQLIAMNQPKPPPSATPEQQQPRSPKTRKGGAPAEAGNSPPTKPQKSSGPSGTPTPAGGHL